MTYTDGLTDLRNENDDFFDTKYLTEFVKNNRRSSVKAFNKALMERIKSFKGHKAFPDDISVLTCRLFGN